MNGIANAPTGDRKRMAAALLLPEPLEREKKKERVVVLIDSLALCKAFFIPILDLFLSHCLHSTARIIINLCFSLPLKGEDRGVLSGT